MCFLLAAIPSAVVAQQAPVLEAAVMNDWRVRGLSWSDGRAAAQLFASLPLASGFGLAGQATTVRGTARHGSADAALDLIGSYAVESGLFRWHGAVTGRFFPGGAGPLDYLELNLGAGAALGPMDVAVAADYAPSQGAVGGSNLYTRADFRFGLPGTPLTLAAHAGRSSGHANDRIRAQRLRPGGRYTDWSLGADYAVGRVFFNATYSDTDIRRKQAPVPAGTRHSGRAVIIGARISM